MKCVIYILFSLLILGCTPAQNRVDHELAAIENELTKLPPIKVDTLVPTLGHISAFREREDSFDQITVTFPDPKPVDTVVLIPAISQNAQNQYRVSRFPVHFKIEAETESGEQIQIADYTKSNFSCPGVAPVVFTLSDERPAKKLTIRITKLPRGFTGKYFFLLNELLVFSGEENIALNAAVSCETERTRPMRFAPEYLVDGYTYFPPFKPKLNSPYSKFRSRTEEVQILFDLGAEQTLDEARFYPNDFSANYSHVLSVAIGFPMEIELRLSATPSFENASPILITKSESPLYISRAPLCKKFPPIAGRYVQITLKGGRHEAMFPTPIISLSEIELLGNGANQLAGIPFRTSEPLNLSDGPHTIAPSALTDGISVYGNIVPQKKWFLQLARRAELEHQKARLLLEKERLYTRQEKWLRSLLTSIPFLAALFLLAHRYRTRQKVQRVREQIADDLHDETGATLNSIANSAQLLEELTAEKHNAKANELLADIMTRAERSAKEIRALILFLERDSSDGDLAERLQHTARQMLFRMSLTADFNAAKQLNRLPPIRKWDILLLFKEALNNIIRHADADAVAIITRKEGNSVCLEIRDNGIGLPPNTRPNHLIRRARKLNAKIAFETPPSGGTTVKCIL